MKITLKVTGNIACDVLDHFKDNWTNNDKLHPELKKIPVKILTGQQVNSLTLEETDGTVLLTCNALRLDLLSNKALDRIASK